MIRICKRVVSLLLALMVCAGPACVKGESQVDTHFVPENPSMMPSDSDVIAVDLNSRISVYGQSTGEVTDEGVRYAGGEIKKAMFTLPFAVRQGDQVTVTVTGRFDSEQDKALSIYLTNNVFDNCVQAIQTIDRVDGEVFTQSVTLTASKSADSLMLSGASFSSVFHDLTIMSITLEGDVVSARANSLTYAESVQQPWYQTMLDNAVLNVGSNVRLREVIARAQAGEHITVATIGGSITEGAGAARYKECYAYQIYDGFRQRYGVDGGSNVSFVNAGVGGTPSTFGWMRWQREVVDRVQDDDGLPDLVIIEFAVNDGGEPTNHRCYESMVRSVLAQPNHPAVILLFSVFISGYTLQNDIKPVGEAADLMMISMRDSAFPYVNDKWSEDAFFFDQYHPTTLGHSVMADCVLHGIELAAAGEGSDVDVDLNAAPAFGTDFIGMKRIFRDAIDESLDLSLGGFTSNDMAAYQNLPVGRVCGDNFHRPANAENEPLTFTADFKNLMIAYRTVTDAEFGTAEVYVDGKLAGTLRANTGSWGQSVVDLLWDQPETATHTVEIRMAEGSADKKFTITCISYTP